MKEEIEQSTDNLYADFGRKNAEKLHSKAILARAIYRIIKQKKLTAAKASKLLDIPITSLSRLLQGKLTGFSTDRLLHILNQLGQDIDIKIKPIKISRSRKRMIGRTSIHTDDNAHISLPIAAKAR